MSTPSSPGERAEVAKYLAGYADFIDREAPGGFVEACRKFRRAASLLRDSEVTGEGTTAAVVGWRSIESAPLDGTFVLIVTHSGCVVSAQFCRAGYWRTHVEGGSLLPTHWMPLPPSPTSSAPPIAALRLGEEADERETLEATVRATAKDLRRAIQHGGPSNKLLAEIVRRHFVNDGKQLVPEQIVTVIPHPNPADEAWGKAGYYFPNPARPKALRFAVDASIRAASSISGGGVE